MKRIIVLIMLGFLTFSTRDALSEGAPAAGQQRIDNIDRGADSYVHKESFRGGQRACVIVESNRRDLTEMELVVKDAKGQIVAQHHALDYAAVIWYPPRDETYTIVITNKESAKVSFYAALR